MTETKIAETLPMLIDGKPVAGESNEFVEVLNPSNGELVGKVPIASEAEIDSAVQSSYSAFTGTSGEGVTLVGSNGP